MSRHKTEGSSALQERKVIVIEAAKRPEAQKPVSYTHLDVYKRQMLYGLGYKAGCCFYI